MTLDHEREAQELEEWGYDLPPGQIARYPNPDRHTSRLLWVRKNQGPFSDKIFNELPSLVKPGDLLIANDTRVMAARLFALRASGGRVELLLLEAGPGPVKALAKPARKLKDGEVLTLIGGGSAQVFRKPGDDHVMVQFDRSPIEVMADQGEIPLPPYLERTAEPSDSQRYQTVFSSPLGAVAAPTAGLHFSPELIDTLKANGVGFETITLHVGIGTFRPLRATDLQRSALHSETFCVPEKTAAAIRRTKNEGGRVIAIGTTVTRALESATAVGETAPTPTSGDTTLFIRPPYTFRCVDGLITNFHLPKSSLLMLVASLIGKKRLFDAYNHAIESDYRFYSYGDAMLIL